MPLLLRFLPAASLLALALSCQQKPAETTAPPLPAAPAPPAAPVAAPTVAQRFSPIISGYWVSAEYLDEVARTRSPLIASTHFPKGPVTILIQHAPATADSLTAGLVYNLHEGSELTLFFKQGRTATSLPVRTMPGEANNAAVELAYQLSPTDTILYYVRYSLKNQRQLSRIAYKRITSAAAEKAEEDKQPVESELYRTLNCLLVAGSYIGTDSLGQPLHVYFKPNGEVIGLPFRTYHVQEDFLGGPSGVNALFFDMYSKKQRDMAASFGRDTLLLFDIREIMDMPPGARDSILVLKPSRLRYQLVREKQP